MKSVPALQTVLIPYGALHISDEEEPYNFDGPLVLKSGQQFAFTGKAELRLKPGSNFWIVRREQGASSNQETVPGDVLLDISIVRGIWTTLATTVAKNGNGPCESSRESPVFGKHGVILLQNGRCVSVQEVTIRQSRPCGLHLANGHKFRVENIILEEHRCDGVDVNGPASNGPIRGVRGD